MTNIQQICDKVQEPLGYKPSYWLLYNLLSRQHRLEKVTRIMQLVDLADRIDEMFEATSDSTWLETNSKLEAQIRELTSKIDRPRLSKESV